MGVLTDIPPRSSDADEGGASDRAEATGAADEARSERDPAAQSGEAGAPSEVGDPVTFVLIDDHEDIRKLTEVIAQRSPEVRLVGTAANAAEGFAVVERVRPDVVVLDVMMPEVSGLDLLPALVRGYPGIKVIMYSAGDDLSEEAAALGACGWITKSEDWHVLLQRIVEAGRPS